MGSKSVLGHQNDVGRGQGATREAHGGSRTAFGRARAAFRRPKGQKVDSVRLGRQQGRGHWKSSTSNLTDICIYLTRSAPC